MSLEPESRITVSDFQLSAADGYALGATLLEPPSAGDNGRAVLINPALGVKRVFYSRYARFLAEHGFTCLLYDYRGIGDSRPRRLRTFPARLRDWGEQDMRGAIAFMRSRFPERRLVSVSHSVGGQVFGLVENNREVSGMLLVGSVSPLPKYYPFPTREGMIALMYGFIPFLTPIMGYFPANWFGLGETLPPKIAGEWARWVRTRDYLYGDKQLSSRENFHRYTGTLHAFAFTDDNFAPRAAMNALLGYYKNAKTSIETISPTEVGKSAIGHFGFFRESSADSLWPRSAEWLKQQ